MDLQPQLHCAEYILRPLAESDFDGLFAASKDPLIWSQHPNTNRHKLPEFERFFKQSLDSKSSLVLLKAATSEIIGSSRYYDYSSQDSEVAIGYTFLKREYWGGATNFAMKKMMTDHAFKSVQRILFHIWKENLRSQNACKKIGARFLKETLRKGPNNEDLEYFVFFLSRENHL